VQAALEAGFDDHLTKPLDPDRLDEILARASESAPTADRTVDASR